MSYMFRAICPKGFESLLEDELASFGASSTKQGPGNVHFDGEWEVAYRACLWSRLANRILYPLAESKIDTADDLYELAMSVDWQMQFNVKQSFRIDFRGTSFNLKHEQFSARKVKDAIVDQFREELGARPNVELKNPDIWLHATLHNGVCQISIDLSGPSLHLRGYRTEQGIAPIKENLAAALLIRAGWPDADPEDALIDPLCGSGTILVEGAMMRANIAPGLYRDVYGFDYWLGHDEKLWARLLEEAKGLAEQGREQLKASFIGFEQDKRTLRAAQANLGKLALEEFIKIKSGGFQEQTAELPKGLIISNPPYGERLGDYQSLMPVYQQLGDWLKRHEGSRAALISSEPELVRSTGIHANKRYKFYNGKIPCQLYCFNLEADQFIRKQESCLDSARLQPLINRLKKNLNKIEPWAKQVDIEAYRIYDHDLPEYAFSVDRYADHVLLYESVAPKSIDESKVKRHRHDLLKVLAELLSVSPKNIILKQRQRQKGKKQYEKQDSRKQFMQVREQGLKFSVNLHDYLDTGLFLDHRKIRSRIRKLCRGKDFLNLFAYTGAATVYAVAGGAKSSLTVDMSNTYLEWAERNLNLNKMNSDKHLFKKADCLKWLQDCQQSFDVIFLDPPSFSNSKSMESSFDIQRDHQFLIRQAIKRLNTDGLLIFSTNRHGFKLDEKLSEHFDVHDLKTSTISRDFRVHRTPHHCWEIKRIS